MVVRFIFSSILQFWYVEVRISRRISESPLEFEITRVDCILISFRYVSAEESPNRNPLLVVAGSVSGTVTVYQINFQGTCMIIKREKRCCWSLYLRNEPCVYIMKRRLFKYIEKFTTINSKFSDKNPNIFHISVQNIDCAYPFEPPRRGGSTCNEYLQSMFLAEIRKNSVLLYKSGV